MDNNGSELFTAHVPQWMEQAGPEGDVVLSSRIRLARNLNGVPFPGQADAEQLERIDSRIVSPCGICSRQRKSTATSC
jgi:protein-arginine kinase